MRITRRFTTMFAGAVLAVLAVAGIASAADYYWIFDVNLKGKSDFAGAGYSSGTGNLRAGDSLTLDHSVNPKGSYVFEVSGTRYAGSLSDFDRIEGRASSLGAHLVLLDLYANGQLVATSFARNTSLTLRGTRIHLSGTSGLELEGHNGTVTLDASGYFSQD